MIVKGCVIFERTLQSRKKSLNLAWSCAITVTFSTVHLALVNRSNGNLSLCLSSCYSTCNQNLWALLYIYYTDENMPINPKFVRYVYNGSIFDDQQLALNRIFLKETLWTYHIVKNRHLMRHFFVWRWRQNMSIGID